MRKILAIVFLLSAVVTSAEPSDRNVLLDSMITQQNYDQLLYRLFPQASQGRVPPLSRRIGRRCFLVESKGGRGACAADVLSLVEANGQRP